MAFPVIPAILAVGAVAWAWWLGKNSNSKPDALEFEDNVLEATVELLPYKEGDKSASTTPDILSKIAKAISDSGATSSSDLEKVMKHLAPEYRQHAEISLVALEFLQWMEQSKPDEYSALALPHRSAAVRAAAGESPQLEIEDVFARIREWQAAQVNNTVALPQEVKKECNCKNAKKTAKKLYRVQEKADKVAAYWSKQGKKQESYPCPEGKGFHIRTCRH